MFRVFAGFMILVCLPLFITFCDSDSEPPHEITENTIPAPAHNSMNSLSWAGTYQGITPCADCPGIETRLTLRYDKSFELTTKYIDKSDGLFSTSGSFTWNESGNKIRLELGEQSRPDEYLVQENRVIQLNMNGEQIIGDLADNYILKKVSD